MRVQENVEVSRIIIDAHVTDLANNLITDLGPDDFRVRVDGKDASIESVEWVSELPVEQITTDENDREVERTTIHPPGRLFVCYVQTDFARVRGRVVGEMAVIAKFHQFVELLQPDDRVALLSFDSHLKLRLDFTSDREQLEAAFPSVLLINIPEATPSVELPSLARLLNPREMKYTASSEKALILLARALGKISGPKNMLLFGWGMGESGRSRRIVSDIVHRAAAELSAARVTVYSLQFAGGGGGLREVAADTGGVYQTSGSVGYFNGIDYFAEQLGAEFQGHYEIEVRNPVSSVPGKLHSIDVRVKRKGLGVRAKTSFVDQP
jgi:VWFA-related protein